MSQEVLKMLSLHMYAHFGRNVWSQNSKSWSMVVCVCPHTRVRVQEQHI
jgi:hypothetical protein